MYHSEKKCEHCTMWTDGMLEKCQFCGLTLDFHFKKAGEKLKVNLPEPPVIKIYPTDSVFVVLIKRIVQFNQMVFYAIVSFVLWFISWVVL